MFRFIFLLFQFILIVAIASWAIRFSKPVSLVFNDIIITTSTSVIIIFILILVTIFLIIQKLYFYIKETAVKFKYDREKSKYEKGYNSFLMGMVALANKDYKKAINETRKVSQYFKDESLSLLLKSEVLKVEKKYDELNNVYESMLKNTNMELLGLRGLMEHNLRAQDYHHAFIYGEKLFNLNPQIDKLYETLINVISKSNNWHKLFEINDKANRLRIISKETYAQNKSIAFFEIAKIKQHSSSSESLDLIEKALKLRSFFPPYVSLYVQMLIDNNQLKKAKNFLNKAWSNNPHPDFKKEIKLLAKAMKISFFELAKFITSNSPNLLDSKIILTESLIENKNWEEARKQISSLLEHKPLREVCLLMAKIEEGDSNDPSKINSWVSRSNYGDLGKIWVCSISNISQSEWSCVSKGGYFNSLNWEKPINSSQIQYSNLQADTIEYISK